MARGLTAFLRALAPLVARDFRLLAAARFASLFGSAMAPIAIAFAVLDLRASGSALALVVGARMLPLVAFMLVGGVVADRLPRGRVMLASNLVAGLAQLLTAALLFAGSARLWQLVVLQAIGGAGSAFFMPALNGLVPQVVANGANRQQANAVLGLSRDLASIGGAALGGLVVAAAGSGAGIAVDAGSFFVSAALLLRLRVAAPPQRARRPLLFELGEGWQEFSARRWVWLVSAQLAVTNATGMACFFVLGPLVAKQSLGGAAAWGTVMSGFSLGLVLGGIAGARREVRRPLLAAPVSALLTVPLVALLALAAPVLVLALAALAAGAAGALFMLCWDTTLQQQVPQEKLARVSSWFMLASFASIPLGTLLVGALSSWLGPAATLWAAAGAVAAAALATLSARDVRAPRPQPQDEPLAAAA